MIGGIPEEYLPKAPEQLPGELRNVAEIFARVIAALRPDLAEVAELLATRGTFAVADDYRGSAIYCHNLGRWERQLRDTLIIEEFDRRTKGGETATKVVRDLAARDWPGEQRRITERTVWSTLGKPDPRQMGLF